MNYVSTISYSVVFNSHMGENFHPTRGLRQGDHLSSFLFLICGEGLSSLMRLAMQRNKLRGVKASRSGPQISHLLFADDCILFGKATKRGAHSLKQSLIEYENYSGQCVNYDKSIVFFSANTQEGDKTIISRVLGVRSSNNPERYPGLPNMDRMKQQIDSWSVRHLSQGGKEVFIKAILQAIPTYTMAQDGGLGFHNLDKFNIALLAKQGWRLVNFPNSLLSRVLKAKYYQKFGFYQCSIGKFTFAYLEEVGTRDRISVWDDLWILEAENDRLQNETNNENIKSVSDLIDADNRKWSTIDSSAISPCGLIANSPN
ncbi:RNA-directed DNA polymerase, related [Gossypium australe]|uniref:RNA-directed DNA polymerase, related n=1 Tax=Gossypium australe TaxID=47621 RepID=A0A5B6WKZ4_9ROSI|nr:RNA-directed DNA polymerase, related [Gossypium australe]